MIKLTNPNYFLPIIEATEADKVLSSGRTRPMIVRGVCRQTGNKGEYVVKLKGSGEMWEGSSLNEIIGSFIALELDFKVPQPAIINISEQLLETMRYRHDNYIIASKSLGYNFGSELQKSYQKLIPGMAISEELLNNLFELFAFDVLIENTDRRVDKHNFLTNGKDLLIYDHELAFSFTQAFSFTLNPNPWLITDTSLSWLSENFCYQELKGNKYDFTKFTNRLSVLNEEFWDKADQIIPEEWKSENFSKIKKHIIKIIDNKEEFASELNKVLS